MANKAFDYQATQAELDELLMNLQRDDTPIDEALKQYERGLELIKALEAYLKTAENTLTKLTNSAES